jgi:cell division protein FtsB
VALAVTGAVLSGQVGGQRRGSDGQAPAARYSPLAAEGGYSRAQKSPLDAMVHALNPHDVDLGAVWEARRRAWLENAGANRYFWYSFAATAALILSWFALAWVHTDRGRERWQLAEHAADALRYAEYCKRRAREAISRYNEHVESCNRVIEAGDSGTTTPETANLEDYKLQIQHLKGDNTAKTSQIASLESQLKVKQDAIDSFTERLDEAERRIRNREAAGQENGNAELVERIQRLEAENRRLKQGRTAPARSAVADDGTGAGKN